MRSPESSKSSGLLLGIRGFEELLDQFLEVRDVEVLGIVDLEVDADVSVNGFARARTVACALLQRSGTAELLDSVSAILVYLRFELL